MVYIKKKNLKKQNLLPLFERAPSVYLFILHKRCQSCWGLSLSIHLSKFLTPSLFLSPTLCYLHLHLDFAYLCFYHHTTSLNYKHN